eukprot:TRINITY_DN7750_c0_g1_i1.p1 TRINITY_DN7750_c0_g1~~TRINITY_DN7750_c0_g1_i1.p1  ORF type:complete len:249 (+),score=14.71 TRINITY_DN7750_c0_g1_i1:153-899(+)
MQMNRDSFWTKYEAASENETLFFKVIVVGDVNVGKTSLLQRYCFGSFAENVVPTIGCDFSLKIIPSHKKGRQVRMQLWDVAGQERFHSVTKLYVRGAVGAIVVVDLSRRSTLESAAKWKKVIDENADIAASLMGSAIANEIRRSDIPTLLLINKADLRDECSEINEGIVAEFVAKHKFHASFFVSAKSGENVDRSFGFMVDEVIDRFFSAAQKPSLLPDNEPSRTNPRSSMRLNSIPPTKQQQKSSCC